MLCINCIPKKAATKKEIELKIQENTVYDAVVQNLKFFRISTLFTPLTAGKEGMIIEVTKGKSLRKQNVHIHTYIFTLVSRVFKIQFNNEFITHLGQSVGRIIATLVLWRREEPFSRREALKLMKW